MVHVNSAFIIYVNHGPENTDIIFLKFYGFCVPDSSPFPSSIPHAFQINFNSLYTALCEQQTSDQATLLLYTLLHQNSNVRTYMLARTDMENLVSIILHISHFLYCLIFWRAVSFPRRVSMFAWLQRWWLKDWQGAATRHRQGCEVHSVGDRAHDDVVTEQESTAAPPASLSCRS